MLQNFRREFNPRTIHSKLLLRHSNTVAVETPQTPVVEPEKEKKEKKEKKGKDEKASPVEFHPDTPAPLKEFFPMDLKLFRDGIHYGRGWMVSELRLKSNLDLHKLWYVLLKELNLLLTMEAEAREKNLMIKKGSRIVYVRNSMSNLKRVIEERESVILGALQLQKVKKETKTEDPQVNIPRKDSNIFERILTYFLFK